MARGIRRGVVRGGLAVVVLAAVLWIAAPWVVSLPDGLVDGPPPRSSPVFTDRHGETLRRPLGPSGHRSSRLTVDALPESMVRATLAAEDKRFFHHHGYDLRAMARAARDAFRHRGLRSGASTLTQQLIKISTPDPAAARRGMARKLHELAAARKLERLWPKRRILIEYLNRVSYGNLHSGCASASQGYFGKPPDQLSPAEAAFLAGLPMAPGRLNPYKNPTGCKTRQETVLHRMRANAWLTSAETTRALAEPIALRPRADAFLAPHFINLLVSETSSAPTAGETPAGTIRTTLDLALQQTCESIVSRHVRALRGSNVGSAGAVVIDNATGDVLALVGSPDYMARDGGQINGAWIPRSPGSALKPFTYLLALEKGDTPGTIVADTPVVFPSSTGPYRPVNYDRRFYGPVTYRVALAGSLNVSAVKVLDRIGGPAPLHRLLKRTGLTTLTKPPDEYGLGLTLGNPGVRLLELTNAYAMLARLGVHRPYRLTLDAPARPAARVADPAAAYFIADMLADPAAREPAFGDAPPLRFPFRVACKTGTSTDFHDNWTLGFTRETTVGVWVGNPDQSPMRGVSGLTGAAPIFHDILSAIAEIREPSWPTPPATLVEVSIDPFNGLRPPDNLNIRAPLQIEWFLPSRLPDHALPDDYSPDGRTRLGPEFNDWFASPHNHLRQLTSIDMPAPSFSSPHRPPCITSPTNGATFLLDPDLPDHGSHLPLTAAGGPATQLTWSCPSLEIVPVTTAPTGNHAPPPMMIAILTPGTHTLTLTHQASGSSHSVTITVVR